MDHKDYEELTKLWQSKMQEFWRDPKVVTAMMDGYANAFKGMQAANTSSEHNHRSTAGDNENKNEEQQRADRSTDSPDAPEVDDVRMGLRDAVLGLSLRVAELEREVAILKTQLGHAGQPKHSTRRMAANSRVSKVCA